MLDLLILGWIAYAIYFSCRRSFKFESIMFGGYTIAIFISTIVYSFFWQTFSLYIPYASVTSEESFYFYPKVNSFGMDSSFYKIVTFSFFFFLICLIVRFIGAFFNDIEMNEVSKKIIFYKGLMGFIIAIFSLYLILSIFAMIPLKGLQDILKHSICTHLILNGPCGWIFNQLWF